MDYNYENLKEHNIKNIIISKRIYNGRYSRGSIFEDSNELTLNR